MVMVFSFNFFLCSSLSNYISVTHLTDQKEDSPKINDSTALKYQRCKLSFQVHSTWLSIVSICFDGGGVIRLLRLDGNDVGITSGVFLSLTFIK
jgi:hypothetical protein